MSHKTAIKIYEIASYVLIIGATVVYFMLKSSGSMLNLSLTMILVALAIAMRWMMERHRFKACEEELDQMKDDLRRLTQLYAEEKKKNSNNGHQKYTTSPAKKSLSWLCNAPFRASSPQNSGTKSPNASTISR